jgi:hypothetical protein
MARKICLIPVANDFVPAIRALLPGSIIIAGAQEQFDRAVTILRLEGDGLPEWCVEPAHGGLIARAAVFMLPGGEIRFDKIQATPPPPTSQHEKIIEQYGYPN